MCHHIHAPHPVELMSKHVIMCCIKQLLYCPHGERMQCYILFINNKQCHTRLSWDLDKSSGNSVTEIRLLCYVFGTGSHQFGLLVILLFELFSAGITSMLHYAWSCTWWPTRCAQGRANMPCGAKYQTQTWVLMFRHLDSWAISTAPGKTLEKLLPKWMPFWIYANITFLSFITSYHFSRSSFSTVIIVLMTNTLITSLLWIVTRCFF